MIAVVYLAFATLAAIFGWVLYFDERRERKWVTQHWDDCQNSLLEANKQVRELSTQPPKTAIDLIRKKREDEQELKRKQHGPEPVSWVGKAALLEHLTDTEGERFERAQRAHEGI